MSEYTICHLEKTDIAQALDIYSDSICHDDATLVEQAPSAKDWDADHDLFFRLALKKDDLVIGFAVITPHIMRFGDGTPEIRIGEISIYIRRGFRGQGLGSSLLQAMVTCNNLFPPSVRYNGFMSRIFPENKKSIAIHEKNGFKLMKVCAKIQRKGGVWRDVNIYERTATVF